MIKTAPNTFDFAQWNALATHPMQSWEWGEVRKNEGKTIVRFVEYGHSDVARAVYLMTIHPLPFTGYSIGYIPKSTPPSAAFLTHLKSYAQEHRLIFIKLEPNVLSNLKIENCKLGIVSSLHPLFTPWNQLLDITLPENDLLKNMHPKTRYNIHLAEKKGVHVHEITTEEGYQIFEKLYFETCERQKYRGHTRTYHRNIWKTLGDPSSGKVTAVLRQAQDDTAGEGGNTYMQPLPVGGMDRLSLESHIFIAFYTDIPLAVYQIWHFKDTLYYFYGGSSEEYKNVMAANLLMWETIKFGRKLGCKTLDMWGSLPPEYDLKDPWAGFTKFKQGYGTNFVEYAGSYDLVVSPLLYRLYSLAQTLREKIFLH